MAPAGIKGYVTSLKACPAVAQVTIPALATVRWTSSSGPSRNPGAGGCL